MPLSSNPFDDSRIRHPYLDIPFSDDSLVDRMQVP
jgi:hypothetical protein